MYSGENPVGRNIARGAESGYLRIERINFENVYENGVFIYDFFLSQPQQPRNTPFWRNIHASKTVRMVSKQ